MSDTLRIHKATHFRTALGCLTIVTVLCGAIGTFGSLATLGQNIKQNSTQESEISRDKNLSIIKANAESDVLKENARLGLGNQSRQLVLLGFRYNQDTFFKDASRQSRAIRKIAKDGKLTLLDEDRQVIGSYENGFLCDRDGTCKKMEIR